MNVFPIFQKTLLFLLLALTLLDVDEMLAVDCSTVNIALSPSSLPSGTSGTSYSQTLTASGGTAPYTFSESGNLPPGLVFNATGASTCAIQGIATIAATQPSLSFTVITKLKLPANVGTPLAA